MKKAVYSLVALSMAFSLAACGGSGGGGQAQAGKIELEGDWKQSNSGSDESYQVATIQDGEIEIFWFDEEDETKALYWAGTYIAPEDGAEEPYVWVSDNDKEKTDTSMLASGDDTKTFTYEKGQISYEASALGVTKTVRLERNK